MVQSRSTMLRALAIAAVLVLLPVAVSTSGTVGANNACAGGVCPGCVKHIGLTCIRPDGNCVDQRNSS